MILAGLTHMAEKLDHTPHLMANIDKSLINLVGIRRLTLSTIQGQFLHLLKTLKTNTQDEVV
jgi:hypothetical protein